MPVYLVCGGTCEYNGIVYSEFYLLLGYPI